MLVIGALALSLYMNFVLTKSIYTTTAKMIAVQRSLQNQSDLRAQIHDLTQKVATYESILDRLGEFVPLKAASPPSLGASSAVDILGYPSPAQVPAGSPGAVQIFQGPAPRDPIPGPTKPPAPTTVIILPNRADGSKDPVKPEVH